jgi:glycosyltransferase involved in cell wall biosynthesis/SAM-dependent methyltransferase
MKVAYFSPLNPQPSGISDYSEELLPHLAELADVTLFVDGFEPVNEDVCAQFTWHDYRDDPFVLETLSDFDAIIYHVGNDHRYHSGIIDVARKHPGIIVFHDFALQDLFLGLAYSRRRPQIYLEEMFACHGRRAAREAAEDFDRGRVPLHIASPLDFPLNSRLASGAEGIIVHSEWSRTRFASIVPSVPVAHINMPINIPVVSHLQLERNGNKQTVQIANFGLITPGKGIEKGLKALARLKPDHDFHYTLVGETNSFFDVRALIHEYGMQDRVTITGHVSLQEFEARILNTDVAMNLRERTVGETSASLCRIMAAGVPTIVYNVGAFSELPGDAVIKVEADENADAVLEGYLRALIEDDELRTQIGERARRHIVENNNLKVAAQRYFDFISQTISQRGRKQFLRDVSKEIASLAIPHDNEQFMNDVAAQVALLAPAASSIYFAGPERGNGSQTQQPVSGNERPGRLPKLEGVDFKRAALDYPRALDAERSYYLRTKPFYNLAHKPEKHLGDGMDAETHRHFTDFANMAAVLALPAGARVLDVGCGSGWLSEFFARLGYDVTGIDISEELVAMATERVRRVPYDVDHEVPLRCRFLVHDVETLPLQEKFDAVICYDALHHFEDERAVMRHLAAMLEIGGLLFILEGEMPDADSATADELRDVMQRYGTLESPFSGAYLRELFDLHGFAVTGDYVSVNGLFERQLLKGNQLPLRSLATDYHYLTCVKVADDRRASMVPDSRNPNILRAEFHLNESLPEQVSSGKSFNVALTIRNAGDTLWLTGQTLRAGVVTPAIVIKNEYGQTVQEAHGHPMSPRPIAPGQSVRVLIPCNAPTLSGHYTARIDLVDQKVCWFEERGTDPLMFSFEVT